MADKMCCGRTQAQVTRARQALAQDARRAAAESFRNGRVSARTKLAITRDRANLVAAEQALIDHEAEHAGEDAARQMVNAVYA